MWCWLWWGIAADISYGGGQHHHDNYDDLAHDHYDDEEEDDDDDDDLDDDNMFSIKESKFRIGQLVVLSLFKFFH